MDTFSGTDDGTNKQFADENGGIAISAIVNLDPRFRMTMYTVSSNPIRYKKIPFYVEDYELSRANIKISSARQIEDQINAYEGQRHSSFGTYGNQSMHSSYPQQRTLHPNRALALLIDHIKKLPYSTDSWIDLENSNDDFDAIVSNLYDVIEYCSKKDLPTTVEKGKGGAVNFIFGTKPQTVTLSFFYVDLSENNFIAESTGIRSVFFPSQRIQVSGKKICFVFQNKLFLYEDGMFEKALG